MLYLAEVKKQTRGFIGGVKTEFKLLACQHNDQSWSAIPTEEIISSEENISFGERTLVLINLNTNRQFQNSPELANDELVRQLQRISRLMERGKGEQEKIEQWKQSLQYQSEELSRRQMELEAREEQIDQMEAEFEYLERQKEELDAAREKLRQEQEEQRLGLEREQIMFSADLHPEQTQFLQYLSQRLAQTPQGLEALWHPLQAVRGALACQQDALDSYWQQLEQERELLVQKQQHLSSLRAELDQHRQDGQLAAASLQEISRELSGQETVLAHKQELLARINLNHRDIQQLRAKLNLLAPNLGERPEINLKIDLHSLEAMPLSELEANVHQLQTDLDKLARFVNEQEEELAMQGETVEALQVKLAQAMESERPGLEAELAEEQERKGMLDETLVGQRRNLREREDILQQYQQILYLRQGVLAPEKSNISPWQLIFAELAQQQEQQEQERKRLEAEISQLQARRAQMEQELESKSHEQHHHSQAIASLESECQQVESEINRLEAQIQVAETALVPIQEQLNKIRQPSEDISQWLLP